MQIYSSHCKKEKNKLFSSHLQSLEIKAKFQGSKVMVRHWHLVSQLRCLPVRMTWSHIRVPDLSVCQFQLPLPASCSHRHWAAGDGPNGGVCASHMGNLDGALNSLQATSVSENSPSSCLDETRETEEKASLLFWLFNLLSYSNLTFQKLHQCIMEKEGTTGQIMQPLLAKRYDHFLGALAILT